MSIGMQVRLIDEVSGYSGFFRLRRFTLEHDRYEGGTSGPLVREVLQRSDVAAALLFDPRTDCVVMVEQFRAGVYAADCHPWIVDIVAGRIESGQSPLDAIVREIHEETGLTAEAITPIGTYFTAPHLSSERVYLYCARVDSTQAKGFHGVAAEGEDIRIVVLDRPAALHRLSTTPTALWAGLTLQWLASQPSSVLA